MDLLLSQAELATDWIGPLIQLVQLGGFGAMAWFFVWIRLPQLERAALEEREKWLGYIEKRDEKFEALMERTIRCIEESNARRS